VRCTTTGKVIAVPVTDKELDKFASTYDKLSERVYYAIARCRGYNVPDGSSGAEIEEEYCRCITAASATEMTGSTQQ